MNLNIEHRTRYTYTDPVSYTIQQLRLTPQDGAGQRVKRWEIRVNGHLQRFNDSHGNAAHTLVIDKPHDEIQIIASGEVETGLDQQSHDNRLPLPVYLRQTALTEADTALRKFTDRYTAYLQDSSALWLEDMMHAILKKVPYVRGSTSVATPAAEAFAQGGGVCQDHAHIYLACCRHLGIPARYVSGYLFTQDGSLMESHAWADVWCGERGWHSLDISNGMPTNGVHVRLAVGLDYRDACPVSGVRSGGGLETMRVGVLVNQSAQVQEAQQQ
jgi:transglutaminase-like putative cysteine protease